MFLSVFAGRGLLNPQSPNLPLASVVSMAANLGKGVVAVSEWEISLDDGGATGRAIAGGSANSFEFRSKLAAGDKRALISAKPLLIRAMSNAM